MKRRGCSLTALLLVSSALAANAGAEKGEETYVAWISFQEAYQAFATYPSSENAAKARTFLPETGFVRRQRRPWETRAVAFVASNLDILEREVEARNREAVRLAFRLGALDEEFVEQSTYMILGKLIRIDPQLFLEELNSHQSQVRSLGGLVSSLGPEYIDRPHGSCLELARRIGALEAVDSEYLAPLRQHAVDALLRAMRSRC